MSLLKKWNDLMDSQTDETFEAFWKEYAGTEQKIYDHILNIYPEHLKGTYEELVKQFDADPVIFMGFMDGINSSLKKENNLDKIKETSELDFDIDYEKLFFNMLKADAEYLFTLKSWENVLTVEKMKEIVKEYKQSKIVHVEKKPGRNDPCPCGSGRKYKQCCGK